MAARNADAKTRARLATHQVWREPPTHNTREPGRDAALRDRQFQVRPASWPVGWRSTSRVPGAYTGDQIMDGTVFPLSFLLACATAYPPLPSVEEGEVLIVTHLRDGFDAERVKACLGPGSNAVVRDDTVYVLVPEGRLAEGQYLASRPHYECGEPLPTVSSSVILNAVDPESAARAVQACLTKSGTIRVEGQEVFVEDRYMEASIALDSLTAFDEQGAIGQCLTVPRNIRTD